MRRYCHTHREDITPSEAGILSLCVVFKLFDGEVFFVVFLLYIHIGLHSFLLQVLTANV